MRVSVFALLLVNTVVFAGAEGYKSWSHNEVRIKLNSGGYPNQPIPNPKLNLFTWSDEIAENAQAYSDQCNFSHSPSSSRPGWNENIYASSASFGSDEAAVSAAVELWASEEENYTYDLLTEGNFSGVGHYTQIIWESTNRVGCGVTFCFNLQGVSFNGTFVVCQYEPAGNVLNTYPYQQSSTAYLSDTIRENAGALQMSIRKAVYSGESYNALFELDDTYFNLLAVSETPAGDFQRSVIAQENNGDYLMYCPSVIYDGVDYWGLFQLDPNNGFRGTLLEVGTNQ